MYIYIYICIYFFFTISEHPIHPQGCFQHQEMLLIFSLLSVGCWSHFKQIYRKLSFFTPSPNRDPCGYSPVIVKFGVWKSMAFPDWDNSEINLHSRVSLQEIAEVYPLQDFCLQLHSGLLCPTLLSCSPYSVSGLSWDHFLNKWLTYMCYP